MVVLNIHLEGIEKNRFKDADITKRLREINEMDLPVILSLPPFLCSYWLKECPELIELVRHLLKKKQNVLGQQGNLHKCKYSHKYVDPWHENYCLWRGRLSAENQRNLMKDGMERLENLLGIEPELYVPPNHYYDKTTLEVAEAMGYKFLTDQAIIQLKPYKRGQLTILPEGSLKKSKISATLVYIHYDEIDSYYWAYEKIKKELISLREIKPDQERKGKILLNNITKYSYKITRDLKRFMKRTKN